MAGKTRMGLGTLNTILNTAPLIIQGATRLVKLVRERNIAAEENYTDPVNSEDFREELNRVHKRLDENSESDLEQIKLIEELARQNEALATSLKNNMKWISIIAVLALLALAFSLFGLVYLLNQ